MEFMFSNCSSLTSLDLSNFNTSNVKNMESIFYNCSSLTSLDLSNFNTSNVKNMEFMFSSCSSLTNLDLSKFDTTKVTNMAWMFCECANLNTIYVSDNWSTVAVTSSTEMFFGCKKLVGEILYDSLKIDYTYANYEMGYFTKVA
jgi:surface protein